MWSYDGVAVVVFGGAFGTALKQHKEGRKAGQGGAQPPPPPPQHSPPLTDSKVLDS